MFCGREAMARVLIVDDDHDIRETIKDMLEGEGYEIFLAADGERALALQKEKKCQVVLVDLMLPRMNGIEVVKRVKDVDARAESIIITGHGSIDTAVKAMRHGAFDYLSKPLMRDELLLTIKRALEFQRLESEVYRLRHELNRKYEFNNFVGNSEPMLELFELINRVIETDSTLLIMGESGTGKEVVARTVHYNGPRKNFPFVPVNCGAIPETLLENELFGHEKGAFTGASSMRIGRFETAHRGTIFLDEVSEMSPALQVKLLRVLEDKAFERIGSAKTIKVDVRVVAATNQDLEVALKEKSFREDLFYRLNVIPVQLPPLRDRKNDIPLLIEHFLQVFREKGKKGISGVSSKAMKVFMEYDWPGNVRELENLVERIIILKGRGKIEPDDLPERLYKKSSLISPKEVVIPEEGVDYADLIARYEREILFNALERSNWIKSKAAKLLSLKRTTLIDKIKRLELEEKES